jgi:hypothetical protein
VVSPNPVFLNGVASVDAGATDALSGVASTTCGPLDTTSVGAKTVTCTATDVAGNAASATVSYVVLYKFVGFGPPVDGGGVLNQAKAGQAIPLKWRITDANDEPVAGLAVSSVSVRVSTLSCAAGTTPDAVEEYATGESGLHDLGDGNYQWNWKTPKSYAGSCKTMHLDLGESITHDALFQFK